MVMESSDEDDDVYTNAAARLKLLKSMKPIAKPKTDVEEVLQEPTTQEQNISTMLIVNDPPLTSRSPAREVEPRTRRRAATSTKNNTVLSPLVTIDLDDSIPSPLCMGAHNCNDSKCVNEIIDCDLDATTTTEDDYTMDVKVRWRSREIERIKLGMHERFAKVFQYFALLENVPENQILLTRKDILINHNDTPASINLQIIDILEGGIVDTTFANNTEEAEPVCKIKIQSSSSTRHFLTYELGISQPFAKLFEYCSKEKSVPLSNVKLSFDGEIVSPSDTPDSLDLDDEACFDLQIIE